MGIQVTFERHDETFFYFDKGALHYFYNDEEAPMITGNIQYKGSSVGFIHLYELNNDNTFYDRCDATSGDCEAVASAICGSGGAVKRQYLSGEKRHDKIYILDHIRIQPKYRNNGIGTTVIKNLLRMLQIQFHEGKTLFLFASDFESAAEKDFDSEEYKKGTMRLIKYYEKLGFRVIKGNVMVYNQPNQDN